MKIESEKVDDLIKIFRAYFDGIIETIRVGEDDFRYNCENQQAAAIEEILNWRAVNMPHPVKSVIDWPIKELDQMNDQQRWAFSLLAYLTRRVKSDEQISEVPNNELATHIECYLGHPEAKTMQKIYYNKYPVTGYQTVKEIVEKIKEQRALAPQAKLF